MKPVTLTILGISLLAVSFAISYRLSIASAGHLSEKAVICEGPGSLDEAIAANGDQQWLSSIQSCKVTPESYNIRVIDCGWRSCQVRMWDEYGFTYRGYTLAKYLSR